MAVFAIEDELHSERVGEYPTLEEAVRELKRLARIPWDAEPNRAPCQNWRNCGRRYEVVEYDETERPWKEQRRMGALEVTSCSATWAPGFTDGIEQ